MSILLLCKYYKVEFSLDDLTSGCIISQRQYKALYSTIDFGKHYGIAMQYIDSVHQTMVCLKKSHGNLKRYINGEIQGYTIHTKDEYRFSIEGNALNII